MESLDKLMKERLKDHHLSGSATSAEVVFAAGEWLKECFSDSDAISVTKLQNGSLYIVVSDSVWAQEVFFKQKPLLDTLQKRFGDRLVQKIRIKTC